MQVNLQPQTRQDRLSQLYREDLEKIRLRSRKESYYRYEVLCNEMLTEALYLTLRVPPVHFDAALMSFLCSFLSSH